MCTIENLLDVSENKYRPKVRYWIPEGLVEEDSLRQDIAQLANRGFGGIEVVSENFQKRKVSSKHVWNSDDWLTAINVILDEAKNRNLTVDISNGMQWPISSSTIMSCDDPSTLYELTYSFIEIVDYANKAMKLPNKRVVRKEGIDNLIAVFAYKVINDKILDIHSYIDLYEYVKDEEIIFDFDSLKGKWCIFAYWEQPCAQKVNDKYYVIDHLSEAGVKANQDYWEKHFFQRISNCDLEYMESIFCDSLEYEVAMEWTRDFIIKFQEYKGYDLRPYLPVIGENRTYPKNDIAGFLFQNLELCKAVKNDYLDVISQFYCQRHLQSLTKMADKFGKKIRYQVAYNKPFCIESAAGCVHIPENESLSRPSIDNLRTMAGAVHLYRKEKYSFECMAEFMNTYGQSVEDIFWWIKRAYMAGVNAQVFHGATYSGKLLDYDDKNTYDKETQWPGYEAFGKMVSNYWNRTLSVKAMRNLLDTITRINKITCKQHKVDVAFLRNDFINDGKGGDGSHIVKDQGLLNSLGYTYEFLSYDMLDLPVIDIKNGRVDDEGVGYKVLLINTEQSISIKVLMKLIRLSSDKLHIYFIGKEKMHPMYMSDMNDLDTFHKLYTQLMTLQYVHQVDDYHSLVHQFKLDQIYADAMYDEPCDFLNIHCYDENHDYYLFYHYNKIGYDSATRQFSKDTMYPNLIKKQETKKINVILKAQGIPCLLDPTSGMMYSISYKKNNGRYEIEMELDQDELSIIVFCPEEELLQQNLLKHSSSSNFINTMELKTWNLSLYQIKENKEFIGNFYKSEYICIKNMYNLDQLLWWHEYDASLNEFAGYGEYSTNITIPMLPEEVYLSIDELNDMCEIAINTYEVPAVTRKGMKIEIRKYLKEGDNQIKIKVFSNLFNMLNKKQTYNYGIKGKIQLIYN